MNIRPAATEDIAAVQACARAAYQHYVPILGREPAPMMADFRSAIEKGRLFVAIHEGIFVGYVICFSDDTVMQLENIAIVPTWQSRGFGRAMIAWVEKRARAEQLTEVHLYTNEKMVQNQVLYDRLGYTIIARRTVDDFRRIYYAKTVEAD